MSKRPVVIVTGPKNAKFNKSSTQNTPTHQCCTVTKYQKKITSRCHKNLSDM